MMKRKYWTGAFALLAVSAVLSVSGCGGQPSEPLDDMTGPEIMSQLSGVFSSMPTNGGTLPNLPMGISTDAVVTTSALGCETITPAVTEDFDNDNVAKYKKYTYDCTDIAAGNLSWTQKGFIEIIDKDDTVPGLFGGVRIEYNVPVYNNKSLDTGDEYKNSYVGFWDYKQSGSALVVESYFEGYTKYPKLNNGNEKEYTYTSEWNYKSTPLNTGSPWSEGTLEIDGKFSLQGKFSYEDPDGVHHQMDGGWTVTYKTKDLTYKTGCSKVYNSGSIIIGDNANNIEMIFNCNSAKLLVNGQESTWLTL